MSEEAKSSTLNKAINKQDVIKVRGQEYKVQMVSAKWHNELVERCRDRLGALNLDRYEQELIDNIVIEPKVSPEDVTPGEWRDLVDAVTRFLNA